MDFAYLCTFSIGLFRSSSRWYFWQTPAEFCAPPPWNSRVRRAWPATSCSWRGCAWAWPGGGGSGSPGSPARQQSPARLHQSEKDDMKKRMNFTRKIWRKWWINPNLHIFPDAKLLAPQGIYKILSPKQQRRPLPSLLTLSFFNGLIIPRWAKCFVLCTWQLNLLLSWFEL